MKKTELPTLLALQCKPPEIPTDWEYGQSVRQVKAQVYKAKHLTATILQELWVAREVLSCSPSEAAEVLHGTNVPRKTWNQYCQDIGVEKRTANRWLKPLTKQAVLDAHHEPGVICEEVVMTLDALIEQNIKFSTIYADPPWSYGNQATRAATGNHYPSMSVEAICELPVAQLVAEDAHLHLWTTNAFLFEAQRVMDAWGFTYKSVQVWVKPQLGIGNYWRVCHEFLVFGMRGKLPMLDAHKTLRSWHEVSRTRHSAKPGLFRQLVEQVSPAPRLEMFAREAHSGWAAFGNDIVGAKMWAT